MLFGHPGRAVLLLHSVGSLGPPAMVDTVVLEASTTELDDVVRLDDRYGRGPAQNQSGT